MADKKQNDGNKEKKRKESILDLSKYLEKHIRVKFAGGREVSGKQKLRKLFVNNIQADFSSRSSQRIRSTTQPCVGQYD